MKSAQSERRKSRRLIFELPVSVRAGTKKVVKKDASLVYLRTRDLSNNGLFLYTNKKYKVGSRLTIEISLDRDHKKFEIDAEVMWTAKKRKHPVHYPGVGVKILNLSPPQRRELNAFIKEKKANYDDALILQRMYISLKKIAAELVEIEERHERFKHFKKVVEMAIFELDNVAHLIDQEVVEVRNL